MGIILTPIALIIYIALFIADEIRLMFQDVYKRKWLKVTNDRKFQKAMSVDILGNYFFGDTLNWLFSKGGYRFGIFGETISSCLGRKFQEKSLTRHGRFWYYLLYAVDFTTWRQQGHCIANIQNEEQINNFLK